MTLLFDEPNLGLSLELRVDSERCDEPLAICQYWTDYVLPKYPDALFNKARSRFHEVWQRQPWEIRPFSSKQILDGPAFGQFIDDRRVQLDELVDDCDVVYRVWSSEEVSASNAVDKFKQAVCGARKFRQAASGLLQARQFLSQPQFRSNNAATCNRFINTSKEAQSIRRDVGELTMPASSGRRQQV